MNEKQFRVNDLVKFNYSEIGKYVDENHTDTPLRNDEVCDLLNYQEVQIKEYEKSLIRKSKKISEQQSTIKQLQEENKELKYWKKRIIEYLTDWFNKTEYLSVLYKINEIRIEIGLDNDE